MIKPIIKVCLIIFFLKTSFCSSQTQDTYFIGHSLIGHAIPTMLDQMANASGVNYTGSRQIINGAPLQFNWNNPTLGEVGNYEIDLATGNYNTLVITEAIPLKNHLEWSDTFNVSNNFYNYFYNYITNGQVYIYETWHCINSGTPAGCAYDGEDHINWRQRLDEDLDDWESIVINLNNLHPNTEVLVVPGGQAVAALYDAVLNNEITGVNNISYFFADDIHLNDIGSYYMACVMYATLFRQSPIGLIFNTEDPWGTAYNSPGEVLGTKLQELAFETVCNYSRSGFDCSTLSVPNTNENSNFLVTQNNNEVNIEMFSDDIAKINLYDLQGRTIISKNVNNQKQCSFKINNFSKTMYILNVQTSKGIRMQKKIIL
ncbi:MAG: T9SS type A sorting domain-containing protein [Polaribacter sp.]|uniref:T9SS type A sorting domain-containing protein n=1 Tax=Polaribacter sp. TaxID=1920175 RepID=UPI003BAF9048